MLLATTGETAEEASNFCRNPNGGGAATIWCYTMNPDVRWEYCSPLVAVPNYCQMLSINEEYAEYDCMGAVSDKIRLERLGLWINFCGIEAQGVPLAV